MLTLPPGTKVFLATGRVDGRQGIDGLSALVRTQFGEDPLSGHMFVFFSRRADRVRVLYWDGDGYVLVTKRLEVGRFRVPWQSEHGHVTLEAAELCSSSKVSTSRTPGVASAGRRVVQRLEKKIERAGLASRRPVF